MRFDRQNEKTKLRGMFFFASQWLLLQVGIFKKQTKITQIKEMKKQNQEGGRRNKERVL
jgi:hypothetical protein